MLTEKPLYYYNIIREQFPNSYLAEDINQIIIGIDCNYITANDYSYSALEHYYQQQNAIAPFAGLFGVFAYECIHFFETLPVKEEQQYEFPAFIFANAKAYLHYSKMSKVYSFYGNEATYYQPLLKSNTPITSTDKKTSFYHIHTDLNQERNHFYRAVQRAKEYIGAGDVFQVVLSEQL